MLITETKYLGSFPTLNLCPAPTLPEYAFIGRSNVGKSSLINALCQRKDLAHVSKRPGKTQMINYFLVNREWHLVDLPGYGYAKRSKSILSGFGEMISEYLLKRPSLQCAFMLLDLNVPAQKLDIDFMNWLGENEVPFVLAFTKADKLSNSQRNKQVENIISVIGEAWHELPQQFCTSAMYGEGRDEILDFIEQVNQAVR